MKRVTIGNCWHCGQVAFHQCARCEKPVCVYLGSSTPVASCAVLRKAPGQVGVYRLVCWPKCVLRRTPAVLAVISKKPDTCEHGREIGACAPCYLAQHPTEFEPVEPDPAENFFADKTDATPEPETFRVSIS